MSKMKEEFIVGGICIMMVIVIVSAPSPYSSGYDKIDTNVHDQLAKRETVRVVVSLDTGSEQHKVRSAQERFADAREIRDARRNVLDSVGEESVKHVFEKSVALEISLEELHMLASSRDVVSISMDKPVIAFLDVSVPLVNASTIWPVHFSSINITGIDETVCVLDTGVDFMHADLVGRNKTCVINCQGQACAEECSTGDDNGHGTHVAGIVAAYGGIDGVGPNISLIGVKVLDASGSGSGSDIDAGMAWCIQNRETYNISVISMSLGTDCSAFPDFCFANYCDAEPSEVSTAIQANNATLYNISVIAATGNDGYTDNISSPACIQNVTAVARSTDSDTIHTSGNRNNITDLVAPGSSINSTKSSEISCLAGCSCSGEYMVCSGTSMSTPHVAAGYALVRQYYRLQHGEVPTPTVLRNTINNSGKLLNDTSGTGKLFPRLDIRSALRLIDNTAPNVSLSMPNNDTTQFAQTVYFSCAATDVQLSNMTVYVWNTTDIVNNSVVVSSESVSTTINSSVALSYGSYTWNCLGTDHNNSQAFASQNYSITVGQIETSFVSPVNETYTAVTVSYNCSAETESTKLLTNITTYIQNVTGGVVYNVTTNVTGVVNSSAIVYNLSTQGNYSWYCSSVNNHSERDATNVNRSVFYDVTTPNVTLVSPANATEYASASETVTFSYNVSENLAIANCSVFVDGVLNVSNASVVEVSGVHALSQTFGEDSYDWFVQCVDRAGNEKNSTSRSFSVSAPVSSSSTPSGGGGGSSGSGGGVSTTTYLFSPSDIAKGSTKELALNDRIKFTSSDGETHHATLIRIVGVRVTIRITSDPIELALVPGEARNVNVSRADRYDLYVSLVSANATHATLYLRAIDEPIVSEGEELRGSGARLGSSASEPNELSTLGPYADPIVRMLLYGLGVVFIIGVIVGFAWHWFFSKDRLPSKGKKA